MRDELDVRPADLRGDLGHAAHDPGGDPVGVVVRRRQDGARGDRAGLQVAGDGLRERPADVDADARASAVGHDDFSSAVAGGAAFADAAGLGAAAGWRRGRMPKTQIAPPMYTDASSAWAITVSCVGL